MARVLPQLIAMYGSDAHLYLLRCLMEQIDFKDAGKHQERMKLLQQQLQHLVDKPNFPSVLFQALVGLDAVKEDFLGQLSKALKLTPVQELLLALGLSQAPDKTIRHEGKDTPTSSESTDQLWRCFSDMTPACGVIRSIVPPHETLGGGEQREYAP